MSLMTLMTRKTPLTDARMPGPLVGYPGAEGRWPVRTVTRPGPGPEQRMMMDRVLLSGQLKTEAAASLIHLMDWKET